MGQARRMIFHHYVHDITYAVCAGRRDWRRGPLATDRGTESACLERVGRLVVGVCRDA
jgi:hypothetical protein